MLIDHSLEKRSETIPCAIPSSTYSREYRSSCNSDSACAGVECNSYACSKFRCNRTGQIQIQVNSAAYNDTQEHKKTALIAGLTTGFVVLALIAATVVGLAYRRRRKKQKEQEQKEIEKQVNMDFLPPNLPSSTVPSTPISLLPSISETSRSSTIPNHWHHIQAVIPLDYDHPQSPFIVGAHSLQIPHLDDTSHTIRRSLNIQPQQVSPACPSRASSVRVTKHDHHHTPKSAKTYHNTTFKRAVSIKHHLSNVNDTTYIGNLTDDIKMAKPTIARIDTIMSQNKDGSISRQRSLRKIDSNEQLATPDSESNVTPTSDSGRIDVYFCPPSSSLQESSTHSNQSQVSVQSNSTMGDGEITVYYRPP
ncbi:hypothetical protein EDC96DRAFT_515793 [Choanephora cucurbitarum]|nr:hypothetical protein EDC96DRAFT_515793 [Choanephora cucurbitarum]